jgi:alcohol dehydrogenase class IV
VEPFSFAVDTEIRFGIGVRRELGSTAAAFGKRAILVTGGHSLDMRGHWQEVVSILEADAIDIVERLRATGEPDDSDVAISAERVRHADADVIIAIGGGSAIDLAKAIGVVAAGTNLISALEGAVVRQPGIPVVALPTTAGSGAEASRAAIVLHRSAARKRGIRGRGVAPRMALVDPELMVGAGSTVTASAGMDALAHAVETAASRAASPLTILLAGEALRRLLKAIPAALAEPDDVGPRASAGYASLLMGINLANSSTCLPHRLQYPVGAVTGTPHAHGVAALMPAWLSRTRWLAPEPLAALARSAGVASPNATASEAAAILERVVIEWMRRIRMRTSLSELGVNESQIDGLVAMAEGTLSNDPGPITPNDLANLYRESL